MYTPASAVLSRSKTARSLYSLDATSYELSGTGRELYQSWTLFDDTHLLRCSIAIATSYLSMNPSRPHLNLSKSIADFCVL